MILYETTLMTEQPRLRPWALARQKLVSSTPLSHDNVDSREYRKRVFVHAYRDHIAPGMIVSFMCPTW